MRNGEVFHHAQALDEMTLLENNAKLFAPKPVQCGSVQRADLLPLNFHFPLLRVQQTTHQMQQSCLTTTGIAQKKQLSFSGTSQIRKREHGGFRMVLELNVFASNHGIPNLRREGTPLSFALLLTREFSSTLFTLRHRSLRRTVAEHLLFSGPWLQRLAP